LPDYRAANGSEIRIAGDSPHILGVDAAPTTTEAILLDAATGRIGAHCCLRALGNPIAAPRRGFWRRWQWA